MSIIFTVNKEKSTNSYLCCIMTVAETKMTWRQQGYLDKNAKQLLTLASTKVVEVSTKLQQ